MSFPSLGEVGARAGASLQSLASAASAAAEAHVAALGAPLVSRLQAVLDVLPALKTPTVSALSDENWLALNTILDESTVRTIIPRLKAAGATGIVEYPLNKIVN